MKEKISRITLLILLLAFALTTLLLPISAFAANPSNATGYDSADDVQYVTSGQYIYNWGARGETATFLSKYALSFYKSGDDFGTVSKMSGGSSQSTAPSSALYAKLKSIMTSAHTYINSYGANNNLLQYTDCQNGGGKISSFYSGKEIGPAWDSGATWNKEHTWPNSKGFEGSDEDDVMMIRPTSVSENSSRGNTAYGQSSGYYNPNSESNGNYDLRGDCARIVLYVYTRWGNTTYMWGSSGVMESLSVLLEWMEKDPVDTWEMGRNDAVQAITGTRNVFVDYPEYAFLLFGKDVPNNYPTPSGSKGVVAPNPGQGGEVPAHTCESVCATCGNCMDATCTEPVCATKCKCLETPAPDSLEVGTAYYMSVVQGNLNNKTLYFNGTTRESDGYPWYFKTSEDKASAAQVFVEESQGGYKLYFINGTTKTYIRLYERSSSKASLELVTTAPAEVYTYDATYKTLILTVGSNKYYIGTYDTYDTLSGSSIDYISTSFPCKFIPVEGGSVVPSAHTCESKCSTCGGCTDATCAESACSTKCQGHQTTPPVTSGTLIDLTTPTNKVSASSQKLEFANGELKVTVDKASSTVDLVDKTGEGYAARVYAGATLTVEYPQMTKIVITCDDGTYNDKTYYGGFDGMTVPGATITCDGATITITLDSATDKFVSGSMASQTRIKFIEVFTASNSQGGGTVTPPAHTCESVCATCGNCTDATCAESACSTKCQGHQSTVTPDATVDAFKLAVTNIQNATTMAQKFETIKTAVDVYNTMNDAQKSQVTTEIETLKSYITEYNANATLQNTNSSNSLKLAIQVAGMVTVAVAALVILKKVF